MAEPEGQEVAAVFDDPLTVALAEQLLALNPGSRLPSERELSEELGVSRTALRDRLSRLQSIGFLERRTGAGTFVRGLQPSTLSEALALGLLSADVSQNSLLTVRIALERQAAHDAAASRIVDAIADMAAAVAQMQESAPGDELYEADRAFHRSLLAASGSPALVYFAEALDGVLQVTDDQRRDRIATLVEDRMLTRAVHGKIFDAVRRGGKLRAMRAVDGHSAWMGFSST